MKRFYLLGIKYELQSIIIGNGQIGNSSHLKKIQSFLRINVERGSKREREEYLKSEEESFLVDFGSTENLTR